MTQKRSLAAVLAAAFLTASPAAAITSIDIPVDRLEKRGRAVEFSAAFSGHSGNGESLSVDAGLTGAVTPGRHLVLLKTSGEYSEFEDEVTGSESFVHVRHQYRILPWLFSDAFVQAQQDRFRRLNSRTLEGGGPGFVLARTSRLAVRAGTGIMHEYERYRTGTGPGEPGSSNAVRSTSYISLKGSLAENVTGSFTGYFQPRLSDAADFRMLDEASVKVGLNSWLSVNLSLVLRHDSRPPAGVKKTDFDVRNGIGVSL